MRAFALPTIATAAMALALTSLAAPAFAASVIAGNPDGIPLLMPPTATEADLTNPGYVYAQPNGAGVYDCQLNEKRTRMERRACGPLKGEPGE